MLCKREDGEEPVTVPRPTFSHFLYKFAVLSLLLSPPSAPSHLSSFSIQSFLEHQRERFFIYVVPRCPPKACYIISVYLKYTASAVVTYSICLCNYILKVGQVYCSLWLVQVVVKQPSDRHTGRQQRLLHSLVVYMVLLASSLHTQPASI